MRNEYEHSLSEHQKAPFHRDKERDIALISMMPGSGVRVSEIATLTLKDINFQKKQIDIIRKGNKADTTEVLSSALEDLKSYLRIRDSIYGAKEIPYVFITKYTRAFNSQEELSSGKALSPHKLRHTFATEWIKSGGNLILLRDQLGHNSIETTQKYTNLSSEERKKVMNDNEKSRDLT